jgi:hypothetical protein
VITVTAIPIAGAKEKIALEVTAFLSLSVVIPNSLPLAQAFFIKKRD